MSSKEEPVASAREDRAGDDALWDRAEADLRAALLAAGQAFEVHAVVADRQPPHLDFARG